MEPRFWRSCGCRGHYCHGVYFIACTPTRKPSRTSCFLALCLPKGLRSTISRLLWALGRPLGWQCCWNVGFENQKLSTDLSGGFLKPRSPLGYCFCPNFSFATRKQCLSSASRLKLLGKLGEASFVARKLRLVFSLQMQCSRHGGGTKLSSAHALLAVASPKRPKVKRTSCRD